MNFFRALLYPMEDDKSTLKVGLAVLIAVIPIVGFFVLKGWEYEISLAVRRDERRPLPFWKNIRGKLKRGIAIRFAGLLYNIPSYIVLIVSLVSWVRFLISFFQQEIRTLDMFWAMLQATMGPRILLLVIGLTMFLATNILYWTGYIRYIETGRFSAFFELFKNLIKTFETLLDDIVVAIYLGVMTVVVGIISSLLTAAVSGTGVGAVLAPILFPAITLTLMTTFSGHLYGQLARRAFGPFKPNIPPLRDVALVDRSTRG